MVSQHYLKECLDYNSETGTFTWKNRPSSHFTTKVGLSVFNTKYVSKVAGCIKRHKCNSYQVIKINQVAYYAHRLAWIYIKGDFSEPEIDHINGNGLDNRILNLREVTSAENSKNMRLPSNNKTGVIGVPFHTKSNVYRPHIRINNKVVYLGSFKNFFEAVCARKSAEIKYGYHENHGRKIFIC